jgi:hypothetical protein
MHAAATCFLWAGDDGREHRNCKQYRTRLKADMYHWAHVSEHGAEDAASLCDQHGVRGDVRAQAGQHREGALGQVRELAAHSDPRPVLLKLLRLVLDSCGGVGRRL